ncbi:MAG: thiamine pyrophosphate-binding protein [Nitrospinota bacterium]|nr:MAG: thiamine pyrophosphate-binding protein [Nitrospinota bacterium]
MGGDPAVSLIPVEAEKEVGMAKRGKITGSHLIGRALKLEGVHNIFTLAGDHILPVLDVMADMDFRFIDTRHEQAAAHMADAWGRITGQPGVCMYTTPGFANALPGLAHALHSESPLISISGSADLAELGRGAMQEFDQIGAAKPLTKAAWMVCDARRIPESIARAMRIALSGRRGPVHLTIPIDVQEQEVDEEEVVFYQPAEYRAEERVFADSRLIQQAIHLLHQAQRPFLIAGTPAGYAASGELLQRFIELTHLPLFTDGLARGLVSDEHPLCFGFFERGLNRAARLLAEADVVLLLGRKQDYTISYTFPPAVAADARIIQIDPSPIEIGRNRGVAVGIVGDIQAVLEQLIAEASRLTWKPLPWLQKLQAAREEQREWLESLAKPEIPMHAMYVHKTLSSFLRPDDYLCFDGGDFCHFGRAFHPATQVRGWWYVQPLGMLGAALPTAITLKLAHPESRVVMCSGDGAFGFNAMEFDTAVRHHLPVVAILGNDAAWGIDRQIQLALYQRPVATDLLQSRYDQVVQGLGGHGEFVERPEDLAPALERAFASGKPALVNVVVQRAISPRAEAAIARRRQKRR